MNNLKKVLGKTIIIYTIIIIIAFIIINLIFGKEVFKYITFDTEYADFQDLLSILVTILSIFVGAIITVATILISMCDKRIIKLLREFKETKYIILCIKISVLTGILDIIILAWLYTKLYPRNLVLIYILMYIASLLFAIFARMGSVLVRLVFKLLDGAFDSNDSIVTTLETKLNKKDKN